MKFQYYPRWRLKYYKLVDNLGDYAWYDHVLCIGPLQFNWKGKPWCTHLRRSLEWDKSIREILLEDLKLIEINTHSRP